MPVSDAQGYSLIEVELQLHQHGHLVMAFNSRIVQSPLMLISMQSAMSPTKSLTAELAIQV